MASCKDLDCFVKTDLNVVLDRIIRANKSNEVRIVIWDKGMPQESIEYVRKGDANWDLSEPI